MTKPLQLGLVCGGDNTVLISASIHMLVRLCVLKLSNVMSTFL